MQPKEAAPEANCIADVIIVTVVIHLFSPFAVN
jgi:hypothetical protein